MKETEKDQEIVNKRFVEIVDLLIFKGYVKNDADFSHRVNLYSTHFSAIKNGSGKNVTVKIINSTLKAFPHVNPEYIFTGKGCKVFDEKESKSKDNGAFGGAVERQLLAKLEEKDQQILEKDRFIMELLKRIDPKQLGKDEVIGLPATEVYHKVSGPMISQPLEAAWG